jgi:hypothetical protein
MSATCVWCHAAFESKKRNALYCSRKCLQATWRRNNPEKVKEWNAAWAAKQSTKQRRTRLGKGKDHTALSYLKRNVRAKDEEVRAEELRAALFWGSK